MSVFFDDVGFTAASNGTVDFVFSARINGYNSPADANVSNGAAVSYRAFSIDQTQFEIGTGSYNSGTGTVSRTVVLFNSSQTGTRTPGQSGAGTKISFTNPPVVTIVALAEDLPGLSVANNFTNTTEATGAGTTAAAIFSGGIEILKKLFVTGIATFKAAVASTSTTTGSVVVTGGVGISGAVVAGDKITGTGFVPSGDISSVVTIDSSATSYTIAGGGTKALPSNTSGLLLCTESTNTGATAIFLLGESSVTLVAQNTGSTWVASSSPAAGQVGVFLNGGTTYTFKNGNAGNVTIYAQVFKTRPSV